MPDKKKGVKLVDKPKGTAKVNFDARSLEILADLYSDWLQAGASSPIAAFQSGLALADLLHSSGLLKDSMYGRIGSMANVQFTADVIGQVLSSATSSLSTLVEATDKHGRAKQELRKGELALQEGYTESQLAGLIGLISKVPALAAAVG